MTIAKKEVEAKSSCPCNQAAIDMLRATSPIKDGTLKEVKCKRCGKIFHANFDTEYCFDCGREFEK